MPFLTPEERKTVKALLNEVLSDADLKEQFNRAQARRLQPCSDHKDAMLNQYAGILQEIMTDRANYVPPKVDAVSPDIETLKKKYFGPKS